MNEHLNVENNYNDNNKGSKVDDGNCANSDNVEILQEK